MLAAYKAEAIQLMLKHTNLEEARSDVLRLEYWNGLPRF